MSKTNTTWFLLVAGIILIIAMVLAGLYQLTPNNGFGNPGSALTFIALASVGIERVLEGFWTYIGLTKGTFWPFGAFSQQISDMSNALSNELEPLYNQLDEVMAAAQKANVDTEYNTVKQQIEDLKGFVDQITQLAPGSQQATAVASAASQLISDIQKRYPTLDALATFASESITGIAKFIVTPVDNLGRRFISLFAGMILGLVLTGVLRLDLVQAIFQSPIVANLLGLHFYWGVVLTGLVIGLGSNPTHEVIQVLQEFKTNLKKQK